MAEGNRRQSQAPYGYMETRLKGVIGNRRKRTTKFFQAAFPLAHYQKGNCFPSSHLFGSLGTRPKSGHLSVPRCIARRLKPCRDATKQY